MNILIDGQEIVVKSPIQFSGGERHVALPVCLSRARNVQLTAMVGNSDELMDVLLTVDALNHMSVRALLLYMPYMPYARQDRVCAEGQASSLELIVNMLHLAAGSMRLTIKTNDLHSPHKRITSIPQHKALLVDSPLADWLLNKANALLVAPDHGSVDKCNLALQKTGLFADELAIGDKKRDPDTGWITDYTLSGTSVTDRNCLIMDDICDGGATFGLLAKQLKDRGAKKVVLFVTHGIWSKGVHSMRQNIDDFYTTNTIFQDRVIPEHVIDVLNL